MTFFKEILQAKCAQYEKFVCKSIQERPMIRIILLDSKEQAPSPETMETSYSN